MSTRVQPIGFFAFPGCPGAESQEALRKKKEEIMEKLKLFLGKLSCRSTADWSGAYVISIEVM